MGPKFMCRVHVQAHVQIHVKGALVIAALLLLPYAAGAATKNGFDLTNATVASRDIVRGGPPRDGIMSLTNPQFAAAAEAGLEPDDRVLGVALGGSAKAYPIEMLTVHEIVNDVIGKQFYAVTFCPLCGSGVVFATNVGETHLNFGVSGFPSAVMQRRTVDSLTVSDGCVELEVTGPRGIDVDVAGHTPCNKTEDCPPGQTCNVPIQTCE